MILLQHPQGSPEWLQARAGACTASRFREARGIVDGLTPQQAIYVGCLKQGLPEKEARAQAGYKTEPSSDRIKRALDGEPVGRPSDAAISMAWTIAHERIAKTPLDDTFTTFAMKRGTALEPVAKTAYEARTRQWVDDTTLILTDDLCFGYSSDGLIGHVGLLEVKCPLSCEKLGSVWEHPDEAHVEYFDQVQGGLWLTRAQWCDLCIYCPWLAPVGKELFIMRIWRDEAEIERLEEDLMRFWAMVMRFEAILRDPARNTTYVRFPGQRVTAAPLDAEPVLEAA